MTTYAVIQPDGPTRGIVLSRHQSRDAAEREIAREAAAFHRRYPSSRANSWLEREITTCERGATRAIRGA